MLLKMAVFRLFSRLRGVLLCVCAMSSLPGRGDGLLLLLCPLPLSWGWGWARLELKEVVGGQWVWSESSCICSQLLWSSRFGE